MLRVKSDRLRQMSERESGSINPDCGFRALGYLLITKSESKTFFFYVVVVF